MSFNNILKAIPTSTNKELNDKLAEFAEFIDIYENAESNKIIISCLKEKEFNSEELELLLPISKSSTELSNKITPSDIKNQMGTILIKLLNMQSNGGIEQIIQIFHIMLIIISKTLILMITMI